MEIITKSAEETQALGREIGSSLKGGEVLALSGDLGSGKTTFIQGLASVLGISKIISPTFILMRTYTVENKDLSIVSFYHLDLYRLEKNIGAEIKNLGLEDIWESKSSVVVIEWADKAKDILPQSTRWISFEYLNDDERRIIY